MSNNIGTRTVRIRGLNGLKGPQTRIEARKAIAELLLDVLDVEDLEDMFWYYGDWADASQKRVDSCLSDIRARIVKSSERKSY